MLNVKDVRLKDSNLPVKYLTSYHCQLDMFFKSFNRIYFEDLMVMYGIIRIVYFKDAVVNSNKDIVL